MTCTNIIIAFSLLINATNTILIIKIDIAHYVFYVTCFVTFYNTVSVFYHTNSSYWVEKGTYFSLAACPLYLLTILGCLPISLNLFGQVAK